MDTYTYHILNVIDEYGDDVLHLSLANMRSGFFTSTNTYGGGEYFVEACEVDC